MQPMTKTIFQKVPAIDFEICLANYTVLVRDSAVWAGSYTREKNNTKSGQDKLSPPRES